MRKAGLGRAGDGFRLAALLRADARIGARRIDQRDDGQFEPVRHFHQADRLAIAFRPRHAEIMLQPAFRAGAFLVTHDHHGAVLKTPEPADDGGVFRETAVAGQRREIVDQFLDIVGEMGPVGMPGDLGFLPCRQLLVGVGEHLGRFVLKLADFLIDIHGFVGNASQLEDFRLEFSDRLLEIKKRNHTQI